MAMSCLSSPPSRKATWSLSGQAPRIRRLVAPPISADMNLCYGKGGCAALHRACDAGSLELVELLLAAGADPTVLTTAEGESVLHFANDPDVLRRLLQLGLPLECRSIGGFTPLMECRAEHCRPLITDLSTGPTLPAGSECNQRVVVALMHLSCTAVLSLDASFQCVINHNHSW